MLPSGSFCARVTLYLDSWGKSFCCDFGCLVPFLLITEFSVQRDVTICYNIYDTNFMDRASKSRLFKCLLGWDSKAN